MSTIYEDCKKVLGAGDIYIACKLFIKWLNDKKVVKRVAKNVLLHELDLFRDNIEGDYTHHIVTDSIIYPVTITQHIDNMLLDMKHSKTALFYNYVYGIITGWETNRIMLNQFIQKLNSYAEYSITVALEECFEQRVNDKEEKEINELI